MKNLPILGRVQSSAPSLNTAAQIPVAQLLQKNGVMEMLICALTALAYLGTLGFGFVYDDKPVIVENTAIRSWSALAAYLIPKAATGAAAGGKSFGHAGRRGGAGARQGVDAGG